MSALLCGLLVIMGCGSRKVASPRIEPQPTATQSGKEVSVPLVRGVGQSTPTPTPSAPALLNLPALTNQRATTTPTATPSLTPKPQPTPTPTLLWPDPLPGPARSKLGLHVQWNNSPEIMEFVRRMKPAVIKAAGDLGFLAEVKVASPSTVTVARLKDSSNVPMDGDPVQAARDFVAKNLGEYRQHPAVDYWEGMNEPAVRERMAWYTTFEAERTRVMASHGLRVAVGTFSAGVPEWEDFAVFLPAVQAARQHKGILALHEYDAPRMERAVGSGLPGHAGRPDRGALALRYRWWYEDLLKPRNLVIPLVISEAGVDGGIGGRPGPAGRGWLDFLGYWAEQRPGSDGTQTYLQQLGWYDAELRRDDYVLGCAIFTAGPMNEDWRSYDITSILRHIATYLIVPTQR